MRPLIRTFTPPVRFTRTTTVPMPFAIVPVESWKRTRVPRAFATNAPAGIVAS